MGREGYTSGSEMQPTTMGVKIQELPVRHDSWISASHKGCSQQILLHPCQSGEHFSGWWLQHPFETYCFSQVGWLLPIWTNQTCSKHFHTTNQLWIHRTGTFKNMTLLWKSMDVTTEDADSASNAIEFEGSRPNLGMVRISSQIPASSTILGNPVGRWIRMRTGPTA